MQLLQLMEIEAFKLQNGQKYAKKHDKSEV